MTLAVRAPSTEDLTRTMKLTRRLKPWNRPGSIKRGCSLLVATPGPSNSPPGALSVTAGETAL